MWGLPQKQNARRAYKIRLCGHLRRYKKIVKKTYIISFTFYNFFTHPIKNHSIIELILCIIIGIIFLIPIFLVHEILHAIWFPKKAKKELWYEINRNSLFLFSFQIYSNCPLKRNRFLLMLLFPNIILALIPLFLWYCGIVFISPFISRIIGSLLTILFTCGASDYSLFFDTVLCTKKEDNIIIFKNEFYSSNTTWIKFHI